MEQPADGASSNSVKPYSVWITGGCGHLGSLSVHSLVRDGVQVLCVDLPPAIERFKTQNPDLAVNFSSLNVFDLEAVEPWCDRAAAEFGVPDALIHLPAASSRGKIFADLQPSDLEETFRGSLTSTWQIARKMADLMSQKGQGSIVLFSSMYGIVAPDAGIYHDEGGFLKPNPIDYGVAKAGIIQMTRYLAMQYGRVGIRVNCIAPGPFPNPIVQEKDPDFIKRLSKKTMLGRIGQPEEMVGPIRFLAGPGSSYMTGQCLVIDGGWTAW